MHLPKIGFDCHRIVDEAMEASTQFRSVCDLDLVEMRQTSIGEYVEPANRLGPQVSCTVSILQAKTANHYGIDGQTKRLFMMVGVRCFSDMRSFILSAIIPGGLNHLSQQECARRHGSMYLAQQQLSLSDLRFAIPYR